MGQKVNPIGFRTGITEDWSSKWYAPKAAYGAFLIEDFKIRKLIDSKLNRRPPFAPPSREQQAVSLASRRRDVPASVLCACPNTTPSRNSRQEPTPELQVLCDFMICTVQLFQEHDAKALAVASLAKTVDDSAGAGDRDLRMNIDAPR